MPLPAAPPASSAELSLDTALLTFLAAFKTPQTLLVAVSGGSDSLGLLTGLQRLLSTQSYGHRLIAATVDHRLRPHSHEEALWVADLCRTLAIPHHILPWTDEKPQSGIPAKAREARYRLLGDAALALDADAIVTGHTLDDQIETVRMRAARSDDDGAPGLAGMSPATLYERRHWILRPLLAVRRQAIRDDLVARGQPWIDDPSNEDRRFERVRLRQDATVRSIANLTEAASDRSETASAAACWIDARVTRVADIVLRVDLTNAETTAGPWRPGSGSTYALQTLAAIVGGKRYRPGRAATEKLLGALSDGGDFRLTLSGTLCLRRKHELFLVRERRGLLPLPLPAGSHLIWDGRFRFDNRSSENLQILPGAAEATPPGLPGPVVVAMAMNMPEIQTVGGGSQSPPGDVGRALHLAPIDHLLPGFDLPLASALNRLFARDPTPSCPI